MDSPTLLKLINNIPIKFFYPNNLFDSNIVFEPDKLFPMIYYQIFDFDMILAMIDGLRNNNQTKDNLEKFIHQFYYIYFYDKSNEDTEYKDNMYSKAFDFRRILRAYERKLFQVENRFKAIKTQAIESIYREFKQRIKIENKNYTITLKEKNDFVTKLSQLIQQNDFTLNNFNTVLNEMNGDLLKTDVLEQFIYDNTQNDNPVNFNKYILR